MSLTCLTGCKEELICYNGTLTPEQGGLFDGDTIKCIHGPCYSQGFLFEDGNTNAILL